MNMALFVASAASMTFASVYWLLRPVDPAALGRGALRDKASMVVACLVPAAALALYAWLGRPDALKPAPDPVRTMAIERTERLAARLASQPGDVAGLRLLARSYEQLGRMQEAIATRRKLVAIDADDADALVDLAEAVAATQGRNDVGEPIELARRALTIEPRNHRALAMAANEAAERDDLPAAIDYWQRILVQVDAESDVGRSLAVTLAEAKAKLAAKAAAQ